MSNTFSIRVKKHTIRLNGPGCDSQQKVPHPLNHLDGVNGREILN